MTDNYDKVSDAISDDQLDHSEQETELQELRDRIAHLETAQGAAGVILRDTDAVSAMCKAARLSKAKTDEGEMPPLFDLLDFSGENKTQMVVFAAIYDALRAIAGETGE